MSERRRSARLSALDTAAKQQPPKPEPEPDPDEEDLEHPPPKKRGRRKTKVTPVEQQQQQAHDDEQQAQAPHKGPETQKQEDHSTNSGLPSAMQSGTEMPEKRLLKLVIDTLQRKDTQGLFAEPVDPVEVEDYYEIIKQPMDFGTLREKLELGIYKSLDEFERDAFLIFTNAMHFNASNTIFFRQARAIYELATKVFHALRHDPTKFELEFSVIRRRPGRKPKGETRTADVTPHAKLGTDVRHGGTTVKVASRGRPRSSRRGASSSNLRGRRSYEGSHGFRQDGQFDFSESGRRSTYKSWNSFLNENESLASEVYNSSKSLVPVNEGGMTYKESLMRFAKDLGPAAQIIVQRKLQQCRENKEGRGVGSPSKFPIDCNANFNIPIAAAGMVNSTSGGNHYMEMMINACTSDAEQSVLPLSMSSSEFGSSSSVIKTNNNTWSPWPQAMMMGLSSIQEPSRTPHSSMPGVSFAQPNPVAEYSQTRMGSRSMPCPSFGVNNSVPQTTSLMVLGVAPTSPIWGLAQEENAKIGQNNNSNYLGNNLSRRSSTPVLELEPPRLPSQLSGVETQDTRTVPYHHSIEPSPALENQPNILMSQYLGKGNKTWLSIGGSSSHRDSLSWKQPAGGQVMGSGLQSLLTGGGYERGITAQPRYPLSLGGMQSPSNGTRGVAMLECSGNQSSLIGVGGNGGLGGIRIGSSSQAAGFNLQPNLSLSSYYSGNANLGVTMKYGRPRVMDAVDPSYRRESGEGGSSSLLFDWREAQSEGGCNDYGVSSSSYLEAVMNEKEMRSRSSWWPHKGNGNGLVQQAEYQGGGAPMRVSTAAALMEGTGRDGGRHVLSVGMQKQQQQEVNSTVALLLDNKNKQQQQQQPDLALQL